MTKEPHAGAPARKGQAKLSNSPDSSKPSNPTHLPNGLRYVNDTGPGFTRRRLRGRFVYFDLNGKRLTDADEVARIDALAIPPAYRDVWICPKPEGHLQATGRDARGRKQYRYHPKWRESRDTTKYGRLAAFGSALPRIRAHVSRDLERAGMPRAKVLAAVVRLLDTTLVRIGSAEYARDNHSFGLTTLRKQHLQMRRDGLQLKFVGKSGIEHDVTINDRRVMSVVRRCMDLAGQELFKYLDADGTRHTVSSHDINQYLSEVSGAEFTAKDYRTWAGSVHALAALRKTPWSSVAEAQRNVVAVVKEVAGLLRNTPAVCRRCYVHPALLEAYHAGSLDDLEAPPRRTGLKSDEAILAVFLARLSNLARGKTGGVSAKRAGQDESLTRMLGQSRQVVRAAQASVKASLRASEKAASKSQVKS